MPLPSTTARSEVAGGRSSRAASAAVSTARVLRIGQERPVTVHIPLAVLPNGKASFDENLHALLERKRTLMRDALMPPEEQPDELADMLRDSLA